MKVIKCRGGSFSWKNYVNVGTPHGGTEQSREEFFVKRRIPVIGARATEWASFKGNAGSIYQKTGRTARSHRRQIAGRVFLTVCCCAIC
jgi:hypothetical protein